MPCLRYLPDIETIAEDERTVQGAVGPMRPALHEM